MSQAAGSDTLFDALGSIEPRAWGRICRAPRDVSFPSNEKRANRRSDFIRPLQKLRSWKRLDASRREGIMGTMKPIASNLSVKSKFLGTGKVYPQGRPRCYWASLTPVPIFSKGQCDETSRAYTHPL